ncbi:glycosyltransferase, partial [bacterium]|nr:glycosyltransferase [bacterium]
GVDIGQFPLRDRYQCRRELAWPEQGPYLGFVGFSLWDMALLADAFAIIKKQVKSAKLVVVGGGVEESAKEVFAHRFQVDRDVYLPGVLPFAAIPQYLGACDIQLLPMQNTLANQARIPNKLMDYFASGRPCVASNVGDTGKYVEAHEAGLVAGESAESLAERCLELVDRPQRAREYGEKARYLAATRFSYSTLTKSLISFYSARRSGG